MSSKRKMFNFIALMMLVSSPLLFCMENGDNDSPDSKKNETCHYISRLGIDTHDCIDSRKHSFTRVNNWHPYLTTNIVKGYVSKDFKTLFIVEPTNFKWHKVLFFDGNYEKPLFLKYEGAVKKLTDEEYLVWHVNRDPELLLKLIKCYNFTKPLQNACIQSLESRIQK